MMWPGTSLVVAALLAACTGENPVPADNLAAPADPPANAGASAANASPDTPPPAAPTYTLAGNGLAPGLAFGTARAEAVAAARGAFGTPTGREHNDECGEGPMDFVRFGGLHLGFQEGRLVGWSLSGPQPALRTAAGLAIGAPRSVLGGAEVDTESTLGPEFSVDDVGGVLDESGSRIEALWAGATCQFR